MRAVPGEPPADAWLETMYREELVSIVALGAALTGSSQAAADGTQWRRVYSSSSSPCVSVPMSVSSAVARRSEVRRSGSTRPCSTWPGVER